MDRTASFEKYFMLSSTVREISGDKCVEAFNDGVAQAAALFNLPQTTDDGATAECAGADDQVGTEEVLMHAFEEGFVSLLRLHGIDHPIRKMSGHILSNSILGMLITGNTEIYTEEQRREQARAIVHMCTPNRDLFHATSPDNTTDS